jgi:hypothetical protein
LRTGNDLRDQADLASTRLVTTGSWFSDCIGASGSLVVVGSLGSSSTKSKLIPTHRKIGHSDSITIDVGLSYLWWFQYVFWWEEGRQD